MIIASIVGARPQFVKAAVVSRRLRSAAGVTEILIHTGQHYDDNLSQIFFDELGIPEPDFHLGIGSSTHNVQTGRMLQAMDPVLLDTKPDLVLTYGDTNSTLAGALAAAKLNIPCAHIEAGLRSFNRCMPEEINRVMTDHVSDLLFTPTDTAVANLRHEGIPAEQIYAVGDVMYDAALHYARQLDSAGSGMDPAVGDRGPYLLATVHRAENTDDLARLQAIFNGLADVARDLTVVIPLHPRTRNALKRAGMTPTTDALCVIEPVGYLQMIGLERGAQAIVTDSGGVQKEAYFHQVPCVTLRDETEWIELLQMGCNRLVPPVSSSAVANGVRAALHSGFPSGLSGDCYGGGKAADQVAKILVDFLRERHVA